MRWQDNFATSIPVRSFESMESDCTFAVSWKIIGRLPISWQPWQPAARRTVSGASSDRDKRYTLTVQDEPVGALLRVLAHRAATNWKYVGVPPAQLDQRVSFSVSEATLPALLQAATSPASLRFSIEEAKITVTPADPSGSPFP